MLAQRLNATLAHLGANDVVTATDFRRALDVLTAELPSREGLRSLAVGLLDSRGDSHRGLSDASIRRLAVMLAGDAPEGASREQCEAIIEAALADFAEEDTVLSDEPTTYAELEAQGDFTTHLKPLDA